MAPNDPVIRITAEDHTAAAAKSATSNFDRMIASVESAFSSLSQTAQTTMNKMSSQFMQGWRSVAFGQGPLGKTTTLMSGLTNTFGPAAAGIGKMAAGYMAFNKVLDTTIQSFQKFAEMDDAMRLWQNSMGVNRAEMEKLGDSITRVARDSGNALMDTQKAFQQFQDKLDLGSKEVIENMGDIAKYAYGMGTPIVTFGEITAATMKNLKIPLSQGKDTMEAFAFGANKMSINIQDLAPHVNKLTSQMSQWGYQGKDGAQRMMAWTGQLKGSLGSSGEAAEVLASVMEKMGQQNIGTMMGWGKHGELEKHLKSVNEPVGEFLKLVMELEPYRREQVLKLFSTRESIAMRDAVANSYKFGDNMKKIQGYTGGLAAGENRAAGPMKELVTMAAQLEVLFQKIGQLLDDFGATAVLRGMNEELDNFSNTLQTVHEMWMAMFYKGKWPTITLTKQTPEFLARQREAERTGINRNMPLGQVRSNLRRGEYDPNAPPPGSAPRPTNPPAPQELLHRQSLEGGAPGGAYFIRTSGGGRGIERDGVRATFGGSEGSDTVAGSAGGDTLASRFGQYTDPDDARERGQQMYGTSMDAQYLKANYSPSGRDYTGGGGGGGGGGTPPGMSPAGPAARPGTGGGTGYGPTGGPAPRGSAGGDGGISAPAGTPITRTGLATVTASNGRKFQVDARFKDNFQGFLDDYEKAGGKIGASSGTLGHRPHNASGHPIGAAIDINQIGRGIRNRRDQNLDPRIEDEIAEKWGLVSGNRWKNNDQGHFGIRSVAAARAALIKQGLTPAQADAAAPSLATGLPPGGSMAEKLAEPDAPPVAGSKKGVTQNNPLNLKYTGAKRQIQDYPGIRPGTTKDQGDPQAAFNSPQAGWNAAAVLALRKFNEGGMDTVQKIIASPGGWTPYHKQAPTNVAGMMGVDPDQKIDLNDPVVLGKFLDAMQIQEQGNRYYPKEMAQKAARKAIAARTGKPVEGAPQVAGKPADRSVAGSRAGREGEKPAFVPKAGETYSDSDPRLRDAPPDQTDTGAPALTKASWDGSDGGPVGPDGKKIYNELKYWKEAMGNRSHIPTAGGLIGVGQKITNIVRKPDPEHERRNRLRELIRTGGENLTKATGITAHRPYTDLNPIPLEDENEQQPGGSALPGTSQTLASAQPDTRDVTIRYKVDKSSEYFSRANMAAHMKREARKVEQDQYSDTLAA